MVAPNEKLAEALCALKKAQSKDRSVFPTKDFSRIHRERLVGSGYLKEIVKGWYMLSNPEDRLGDSTAWYANFFSFVAQYCNERVNYSELKPPSFQLPF